MIHRYLCRSAAVLLLGSASLFAQSGAKPPADLDADSHARLPYLKRADLDEKGQKIYDTLPGRGQDGILRGPLAWAAYNLAAASALHDLHDASVGGTLDPHARELAILVACRATNYNLEWNGHQAIATKAGLDANLIEIVRTNGAVTGLPEKDALVIRFGRQLFNDKKVDSATFAKGVELFGKRGMMDMTAVMANYAVSGYFAIAVDEHSAPGKPELPLVK
jgi:4-carboxymuconolactone decarboxylase